MGYTENVVPGEVPEVGAIFMSNTGTKKECFRRKLFGLSSSMSNFVKQVKKGMVLFLFEFEKRQLFGVYQATSDGEINIEPNAFKSSGKHFPAQVCFTQIWNCSPLAEPEFRSAIRDNYYSGKKFHFGLSENQVRKLMMLFRTKRIWKKHQPERHFWREVDNPAGDNADLVSDRIGFAPHTYSEFVGDEVNEEGDDRLYLKRNSMEKINNSKYGQRNGNRSVMAERSPQDNTARILVESHYSGDRQTSPGECLDHSLRWLRTVADADPYIRGDVNDEHELHNNFAGKGDRDCFYTTEKTKNEINIEDDGHGGERIGVARSDGRFLMDDFTANRSAEKYGGECDTCTLEKETCNRRYYMNYNSVEEDEYPVVNGFSAHHLGSPPCNRGSQTITDGKFFSPEIVESEEQRTADAGMLLCSRHGGIKSECDKDFSFGQVSPTTRNLRYSLGTADKSTNDNADFFLYKQNTNIKEEDSYYLSQQQFDRSELLPNTGRPYNYRCESDRVTRPPPPIPSYYDPPDIQLQPSSYYFAGDNCSNEEELCMRSRSLAENKDSMRYKAADAPPWSSESHHLVPFHETRRDGSPISRYIQENKGSMSRYQARSSQSPFHETRRDGSPIERYHQENKGSISRYKARSSQSPFHETRDGGGPIERYHLGFKTPSPFTQRRRSNLNGTTNKRVSVFARLSSTTPQPQENGIIDKEENDLVDDVMEMLENVVKSSNHHVINRQEDDDEKHNSKKIKVEYDEQQSEKVKADTGYEGIIESDGSKLQEETRFVDFKRRRKKAANNNSPEVDNTSVGKRRRKLVVRPENKSSAQQGVSHGNGLVQEMEKSCENVDRSISKGTGNGDNSEVVLLAQVEEEEAQDRGITPSKDQNWCGWIEF